MQVTIAGGHGKIAMRLARLLADRGDEVRALIRKAEQADEVRGAGAEPIVVDLEAASEEELAAAVGESDAVVFAAGAGPGSGVERKETVDYGAAVKLIAAAEANGVDRYAIVSSIGADADHAGAEVFDVYLRAKGRADAALAASGLDHTIVRPGSLTDEPGSGRVRLGESVPRGEISRDDVAAVLAEALRGDGARNRTFEVVGGKTPIATALAD